MELTDDELEWVAGGAYKHVNSNGSVVDKIPPKPKA